MYKAKRIMAMLLCILTMSLCFSDALLVSAAEINTEPISSVMDLEVATSEQEEAEVTPKNSDLSEDDASAQPEQTPGEDLTSESSEISEPEPVPPQEEESSSEHEESSAVFVGGYSVEESARNGVYLWPVPTSGTVTQGYLSGVHTGIDIAADSGTEVIAVAPGKVVETQQWDGISTGGMQSYGNMVDIQINAETVVRYAHLSAIHVTVGDYIQAKDVIGLVGSSGNSTGSHLHFEIIKNGIAIDPKDFVVTNGVSRSMSTFAAGETAVTVVHYKTLTAPVNTIIGTLHELPTKTLKKDGVEYPAYCLEKDKDVYGNITMTWTDLSVPQANTIRQIIAQGFSETNALSDGNTGANTAKWLVTQYLVWAAEKGFIVRNSPTSWTWDSKVDTDLESIASVAYNPSTVRSYYAFLKNDLMTAFKVPSFSSTVPSGSGATEIVLTWNGSHYTTTVTDTNNVLANYNFTDPNLSFTRNGNNLTISTTTPISTVSVRQVDSKEIGSSDGVVIWECSYDSDIQKMGTNYLGRFDPLNIYLKVKTTGIGNIELQKTSEDGVVAGLIFNITGGGQSWTRTTDTAGGINLIGLQVYDASGNKIQYTATETGTPGRYVQPQSQTFTLTENTTTTINFSNVLKKGNLHLQKSSEDGVVAGLTFDITGGGQSWTKTTDAAGGIDQTGMPVYGSDNQKIQYTATETATPGRYVQPQSQTFTLTEDTTTTITFSNILKKWQLTVTKQDGETTTAQGDASLAGAVYGIYKGGVLKDTYTTDTNHQFTTKVYYCDTDFTLKEITPSPGYQLDTTVYAVGMHPGSTTIELNPMSKTVTEDVIKGNVQLHKFLEKYNSAQHSGQRDPEPDAVFELYLTSAGSYAAANTSERDLLTTDADGIAVSKQLPYGWYTAHQIAGNPSYSFADDFQVQIAENGKTYVYYIGNAGIYSQIKLIKKDAETKEIVPFAGTGFKIKDMATGEFIEQVLTYPSNIIISEFYTNAEGWLILPEPLLKGDYELYEIVAPDGYVLTTDPIPFTVDGSAELVEVVMENRLIYGSVEVTKVDAEDAAVLLSGAEFEVYQELDGQEVVVGNLEETTPGVYRLDQLTVGKYYLKETKAPVGHLLDEGIYPFEILEDDVTITIENDPNVGFVNWQIPEIHTTATADGEKEVPTDKELTIVDTVAYQHLKPGEKYTVTGKLMDKLTEEPFLVDGKEITSKVTFTPNIPTGSVEVAFTFDATGITQDTDVVVFESLYHNGIELAVHADIEDEGQTVKLIPLKGTVTTTKVNAEDPTDKLSGADFAVYTDTDGDGKYTADFDTLAGKLTEIETGVYQLEGLLYGKYLIHEEKAPEGFVRDPLYYAFEITEDGQMVKFDTIPGKDFPNQPIKGTVRTEKVNAEDSTDKLSGADFAVYTDTDGDGKYTADVDTLAGKLTEIETGVYQLEGLLYGKYLIHEEKAPEGFVRDDIYYAFEITEDGQVVKFDTIPGKDFPNKPIKGTVSTTKVDADNPTLTLSGAVFEIFKDTDKDGKYTEKVDVLYGTLKENEKGVYSFESLPYGKYLIHEQKAPDGYIRDTNYYAFEITEDGQTVKFETIPGNDFPNTRQPETPKTGDTSNLLLLSLITAAALLGIFSLTVVWLRKSRRIKIKK